jgi:ectoine hydroxylase-related dioxygenase (phytanoyl-CoA dioxygenase family)
MPLHCKQNPAWKSSALEALRVDGFAIVDGVLEARFLDLTRAALRRAHSAIVGDVGQERLSRAGELGVLRLAMKFDPHFFAFLEIPEVLEIVDATVSHTAILHLQNGFVLPSLRVQSGAPGAFQTTYHQDFPRYLNGYVASVNVLFAIDEFRSDNGCTYVVPGTHQQPTRFDTKYCQDHAIPATCPAGSMLLFDSTLWHAAGVNTSGADRMAINHQFTRSYIKQQIDYVRALGDAMVVGLPPRTQQLLGYYTRVVTSLDEYYQPEALRLYRKGQG